MTACHWIQWLSACVQTDRWTSGNPQKKSQINAVLMQYSSRHSVFYFPLVPAFFSMPPSTCALYFVHFYHCFLIQAILPLMGFKFLTEEEKSDLKFLKKRKTCLLLCYRALNNNELIKHQQLQCRIGRNWSCINRVIWEVREEAEGGKHHRTMRRKDSAELLAHLGITFNQHICAVLWKELGMWG